MASSPSSLILSSLSKAEPHATLSDDRTCNLIVGEYFKHQRECAGPMLTFTGTDPSPSSQPHHCPLTTGHCLLTLTPRLCYNPFMKPSSTSAFLYALLGAFLGLTCLAGAATLKVSSAREPGSYVTIALALQAASPGDTIELETKTYLEPVRLKEGVALVGKGTTETILAGSDTPLIAKEISSGSVKGLTVQCTGTGRPAFWCGSSPIVVEDCLFKSLEGHGMEVHGQSSPVLRRVTVLENGGTGGLFYGGTSATLESCIFRKSKTNGLEVRGSSTPSFKDCLVEESGAGGVLVIEGSAPVFDGCIIRQSKEACVFIDGGSAPLIKGGGISGGRGGILMAGNAHPQLIGLSITKNTFHGIQAKQAFPAIHFCTIANNQLNGILLLRGTNAVVSENLITGNQDCGIQLKAGSRAEIARNTIHGNRNVGLWLMNGGFAEVEGNLITGQVNPVFGDGLNIWQRGQMTGGHNDVWGNAHENFAAGIEQSENDSSVDPLYTDAASGDFTLKATSPARALGPGGTPIGHPETMTVPWKLPKVPAAVTSKVAPSATQAPLSPPTPEPTATPTDDPPAIRFLFPKSGATFDKKTDVSLEVSDDQGLTRVRVSLNGMILNEALCDTAEKIKEGGFTAPNDQAAPAFTLLQFRKRISWQKGENKLEVAAWDGLHETRETLTVTYVR